MSPDPHSSPRRARSGIPLGAALLMLAAAQSGCRPHEPRPTAARTAHRALVRAHATPEITTIRSAGKRFTVGTMDLATQRLDLFWRDDAGAPFKSFTALALWLRARGRKLVFAMNAGMYREDFSPVGLYAEHGKQLRPLNLGRGSGNFCLLPNGVFAVTRIGAVVVESSRYPGIKAETLLATQSGPMLVIDGQIHPKFGPQSESRLIRNGVGVVSPQQVVFAISEDPVNFYEFATFFRDSLRCRNALYLDGTVSSLYSTTLNRNDNKAELGPIIAVVEAP